MSQCCSVSEYLFRGLRELRIESYSLNAFDIERQI